MLRLDLVMVRRMFVRLFVDKQQTVLTVLAVDLTLTELILAVTQPMCFAVVVEHCKSMKTLTILKFTFLKINYISGLSTLPCCDNLREFSADSTLSKVVTMSLVVLIHCSIAANSADVLREL